MRIGEDRGVRVLIFHGYLLRGTGSNVYSANVAQALARAGHDVHLLCQDLHAAELAWVDAAGTWRSGELAVETTPSPARPEGEGSITAYLPDIGGLLPVYVADDYEGFEARTFPEMSDEEIEAYVEANVAAVKDIAARAGGIDRALSNHLVMGPAILARAGVAGYAAKIHGSALSYTVIPNRERFLPYAEEGLDAASAVLVGSAHTGRSLWQTVELPGLEGKTRLGPPGVDVGLFSPLAPERREAELGQLADRLEQIEGDELGRDGRLAASAVRAFAAGEGPRVIFVGKLIVSKGCDLLLAAWPRVVAEHPGARLLMVGFGEYADSLARMWEAIGRGDLEEVSWMADHGRELEGGERSRLDHLRAFMDAGGDEYRQAGQAAAGSVDFAGRFEYQEVAAAVRASDAMVVPSTFPEAFGMVAAEAAATGALPVCARHSGLAEVAGALSGALPSDLADLPAFELGPRSVDEIADRLLRWLALPEAERLQHGEAMREVVLARWSWERVGETVLAAAGGDLGGLDPVPDA